jgi:hypothetical protein
MGTRLKVDASDVPKLVLWTLVEYSEIGVVIRKEKPHSPDCTLQFGSNRQLQEIG